MQNLKLEFEADGKRAPSEVTVKVQQLTGLQQVKKLDLTEPSLKASELNAVACTLIGLLMVENQTTHTLRINPGPGAEGGKIIERLHCARGSALRTLDLTGVGLGDRGAPVIFTGLVEGQCPMLSCLKLASNELTDRSLAGLIKHLHGDSCSLTSLDLSSNRVSGKRLRELLMHNTTLHVLDVRAQEEGLADDDDWAMIGSMLLKDSHGGRLGCLSCDLFDLHEGTKDLNLSRSDLGPGGRELLCGVLSRNVGLQTLKLAGAGIDLEAAKQLAVALARNESVTELDLSANQQHVSEEWMESVASAVSAHAQLVRIRLDEGTLAIDQLRGASAVPTVNFANMAIGELSSHVIAALVCDDSALEELSLRGNPLGAASAELIVHGLAQIGTITSLNLSETNLGGEAPTQTLFAELGRLDRLRTLSLTNNDLRELADSLCRLSSIQTLHLQGNRISKLPLAIGQMHELRELTLQGNRLSRLPSSLSDCSHLEVLDLRANALQLLPPGLGKLSRLRRLELAKNKLTALPSSLRDSSETLLIDVTGNNGLQSPPFSIAKQGIPAIRRFFQNESQQPSGASGSAASATVGLAQVATPSLEHRRQKMRERGEPPPKAEGAPSRHNWVKPAESIILLFNCHGAPIEVSAGEASSLPATTSLDIMIAHDSSEAIGSVRPLSGLDAGASLLERVEFHNLWARVDRHADVAAMAAHEGGSDFVVDVQLWSAGSPVEPPVFLRVYPHLAYGCRVGARCELREGGNRGRESVGSATVREILADDRCVLRMDNVKPLTTAGGAGSVLGGRPAALRQGTSRRLLRSTTGKGFSSARALVQERMVIDLRPDTVVRTTLPQYRPGDRLLVLNERRIVDATVHRCLAFPPPKPPPGTSTGAGAGAGAGTTGTGAGAGAGSTGTGGGARTGGEATPAVRSSTAAAVEGSRHQLRLHRTPSALDAPDATSDDADAATFLAVLDLNKCNHCAQRQLPSGEWITAARYEAARMRYCAYLKQTCATIREASTGKLIRTDLQEAACGLKDGRGMWPAWSHVETLEDLATQLAAPWEGRSQGGSSDVQCILGVGRGFEQEWALRQCVFHLATLLSTAPLRQADEGAKTFVRKLEAAEAVRLVPLVLSTKELARALKGQPESTLADVLADGRLCEWYLDHCAFIAGGDRQATDEELAARAMLQQARAMHALVVVLDFDEHFSGELKMDLGRFVGELLQSGNRLLLLCRPDSVVRSELDDLEETFAVLSLRSLQLNLTDSNLADLDGARLVSAVTGGSVFSTEVSALHLGENRSLGTESGKLVSELLKGKCAVEWLDLHGTGVDGRSLAFSIKMNATLTYLDVRSAPRWDDAVFHVVGSALLEKGCRSQLRYLRCDEFELLPGTSAISLCERALGIGAFHLLAAMLRHNSELRDLDLSATDADQRGAVALATALESNTTLSRLSLRYNHFDDEALELLHSLARPGLELEL